MEMTEALAPNGAPRRQGKLISNEVLGVLLLVIMEIMFFVSLTSAYLIERAGAGANWLPPMGVRLPVWATGFNTAVLLASAVTMILAGSKDRRVRHRLMIFSFFMGLFFLGAQGNEWFNLVAKGMTMKSGVFAAIFFLIIGAHALHVLGGLIALGVSMRLQGKAKLTDAQFRGMQVFWFFVVGIWPILYGLVYFG
ncbi:MAG: cytochrome c oxidase subunit 3 [Pseudomonadota bacterium]